MTRTCLTCCHRYYKDYGYSDWTVEGTDVRCRYGLNPDYPAQEPYSYEQAKEPHTFAEKCPHYFPGDHAGHFSVEEDVPEGFEG